MVRSAVSSVRTAGVLVTVMPRASALATSIWSMPLEKEAISRRFSPAWERRALSMRSVTVGTSTSATFTASTSAAESMGMSSTFRRASNSSRMRVSTLSGSFRVTTTSGLRRAMASHSPFLKLYRSVYQTGGETQWGCAGRALDAATVGAQTVPAPAWSGR